MISSMLSERVSIKLIGEEARDIITSSSHGTILARFSKVIYLSNSRKDLIWLSPEGQPMHRRCVQMRGVLPRSRSGSNYKIYDGTLELEGGIQLDLNGQQIWKPERFRLGELLPPSDIVRSLFAIMTSLQGLPSPKGFGRFLPEITHMANGNLTQQEICPESSIVHPAWSYLREICAASSANNHGQLLRSAKRLIGLGEGLTPSGDDFLGGMLFTLEIFRKAIGQFPGYSQHDMKLFLAYAKHNTNIISYTILADHVYGHGSEVLHQFVNAVLVGEPRVRLRDLIMRIIEMGHSTGWDILTGVLTGMFLGLGEKAALEVQLT